jgi:hypothetical protein
MLTRAHDEMNASVVADTPCNLHFRRRVPVHMNDVREGSAPTAPGCPRGLLLTGDLGQGKACLSTGRRARVAWPSMRLASANIRWGRLTATVKAIHFGWLRIGGRCVLKTRLGRFVKCALTVSIVACLVGCTESDSRPNPSPTPAASSPSPSSIAANSPSAEELNLRRAERAVARFWRVVDRLSADPESDLTELTTVSRGSVAAQWAKNINQDRYDRVRSSGNVVVRDAMAKRSKKRNMFQVTACVDVSGVSLRDEDGKSVIPADRPHVLSITTWSRWTDRTGTWSERK